MENPDYSMAKRYGDNMKTMWFTFFYAPVMPMGVVFSLCALFIYYWIDKYNLLRRRTVHETISLQMTIEMIELLEMIIPFYGIANFIFQYQLFKMFSLTSILIFIIGIVYSILPMQWINEKLFPIESKHEELVYSVAELDFDTDYDRENPVTKEKALSNWKKRRVQSKISKVLYKK